MFEVAAGAGSRISLHLLRLSLRVKGEILQFCFGTTAVVICDLFICAFQYVHHFIVAQVMPELWGDLYDILILMVFVEALCRAGVP